MKPFDIAKYERWAEPIAIEDDVYTLAKFKEMCQYGSITDYDGFGHLAIPPLLYTHLSVYPSDMLNGKDEVLKYRGFTHVVWFNR